MGNQSITYVPISDSGVAHIKNIYQHVPADLIDELYEIFTDDLTTETLLFTALCNMLDRYYAGEREQHERYGELGSGFWLSAITNDETGKMQTYEMKLLHDVMVEMQMAGRAMRRMKAALTKRGIEYVSSHSCGGDVVAVSKVDDWFEARRTEEALRTRLDWEGSHVLVDSGRELLQQARWTHRQQQVLEDLFETATSIALAEITNKPIATVQEVL